MSTPSGKRRTHAHCDGSAIGILILWGPRLPDEQEVSRKETRRKTQYFEIRPTKYVHTRAARLDKNEPVA
jgi:hypothetical protein